jgi:hypothetical protein
MDLYEIKIIGWRLSDGMSTDDPSDSKQAKQTRLGKWKLKTEMLRKLDFSFRQRCPICEQKVCNCA